MNSYEAMMLREDAARNYLVTIDQQILLRYGEIMPTEVADIVFTLREGVVEADEGTRDVNSVLAEVIDLLDEWDCDDYFGTQGWRYFIMGED